MKKIITTLLTFLLSIVASSVFANTGVFYGVGNQVIPIKNNDIRLEKENVTIKLTIEKDNGKFGVPLIPWANVTATFYFKNTVDKKVAMQMGFPFLDLQGFGDETYVLKNLDFKVLSDGKSVKTELKEGLIEKKFDPEGLFKKVFAWKESFTPHETKTVVVSYKLLMGVASANSVMRDFEATGRKYYELDRLFPAINYNFGYITKTAYTWAGPIDEAIFEFDSREFIEQLSKPDFIKGFGLDGLQLSRPVYLENIFPTSYQKKNGIYEWKFKGKVPEEGLSINFLALFIPLLEEELRPFLKANIQKLKETTPDEYHSVLKQYYGLLTAYSKPSNQFLSGYFKDVRLTSGQSSFIFDGDKKYLQGLAERFDSLTDKR